MSTNNSVTIHSGAVIGGIVAVVMSWIVNHSIVWAILHFFCGWIYVVYWILVKTSFYGWLQSLVR